MHTFNISLTFKLSLQSSYRDLGLESVLSCTLCDLVIFDNASQNAVVDQKVLWYLISILILLSWSIYLSIVDKMRTQGAVLGIAFSSVCVWTDTISPALKEQTWYKEATSRQLYRLQTPTSYYYYDSTRPIHTNGVTIGTACTRLCRRLANIFPIYQSLKRERSIHTHTHTHESHT